MALVNPSSLYTGGNERFNPNPYLNIVFRARQQKAAKDAALNQYYSELHNKINDKGMRDQDIQGLNDKKDQLQQFYLANSDAIKNPSLDKGASQYQYGKIVRDIQGGVQKSLNEGKTGLELGKMHQSGQNDYIWQDPDIIAKIAAHEKPIWDSDHVPLNMDELMKPPKPLDPKPIQAIMKGFPMQQGEPVISETPGDKYSNTITPTFKFSDDSKNAINNYGTTLYHNNPSLKREIDNASPEQKTQLNDIYKKHFGINATTPEQLATGYAISLAPTPDTKPKIVPNWESRTTEKQNFADAEQAKRFKQAKEMQATGLMNAFHKMDYAKKIGLSAAGTPPDVLNEYAVSKGQSVKIPGIGVISFVDSKDIDPKHIPLLGVDPVPVGNGASGYIINADGSWTGAKGQSISPVATADNFTKLFGNTKFKLDARQNFIDKSNGITPSRGATQTTITKKSESSHTKVKGTDKSLF